MLNEVGRIIDDLILYRLIIKCWTRQTDLAWMEALRGGFDVALQ